MWEDIVANDPEWNAKLMLVPGLTDAWSGELKETFTKATEEFVVRTPLPCITASVHPAALTLRGSMTWPDLSHVVVTFLGQQMLPIAVQAATCIESNLWLVCSVMSHQMVGWAGP